MIIYRIEHDTERRGPYTGHHCLHEICYFHNDSAHPTVEEDTEEVHSWSMENSGYIHGMPSRESLYDWFKGFFQLLIDNDFVLKIYESFEGDFASGIQTIFLPHEANLIRVERLNPEDDPDPDIVHRTRQMEREKGPVYV